MHKESLKICVQRITATLLVVSLLGGCAQMKEFFLGPATSSSATTDDSRPRSANYYLDELHRFAAGDEATQAEIFTDTESAATAIPETSTRLSFALVLATPGHAGFDPEHSHNLLHELLAETEVMTEAEISLATIYLKSVEELIALRASAHSAETSIDQRLAIAWADNDRLKRELEEAEQKLDAITSIERSIRAQDP